MRPAGCALVTDGGHAFGAAIAAALASDGWPVGIHHRGDDGERADRLVDAIRARGGRAAAVGVDLGDAAAVGELFDRLEPELGPVLVLVNNGELADPISVLRALWSARRALPAMRRSGFGRVVNVAAGLDPDFLLRRMGAGRLGNGANGVREASRAAARSGLAGLTRTLAAESAAAGITVNAVTPGLVGVDLAALDRSLQKAVPARRAATNDDIAACVRFLASTGASYVTGNTLSVDGGLAA